MNMILLLICQIKILNSKGFKIITNKEDNYNIINSILNNSFISRGVGIHIYQGINGVKNNNNNHNFLKGMKEKMQSKQILLHHEKS